MEADLVLAVLLAIMAAEAHLQQFKQAVQRWAEVVTAGRLQTCTAWAHFQVRQRVRAKQRQARKRRRIRNLQILGERLPGQRWWVYPRSSDWWDNFVMHIWGKEKWLENFRMSRSTFNWLVDALRDVLHRWRTEMRAPVSMERRVAVAVWWMANNMSYRAVAHHFGLARSTVASIVVEVTWAITERLLERVVYLRDPDKDMSWSAIMSGGLCPCQLPSARPATTLNWITVAHKRTYPVVVVSSREGSPGEVRQPDLAAVMQVVEERLRTVESGMVNIRRTLNRHSYRLGFIQRGMVRQRNMLQRAMCPGQHITVRRRA
ncbi:UNVERIFIED_CONTAM: hypothetical protein K2H54_061606 [Gekko kuhli]